VENTDPILVRCGGLVGSFPWWPFRWCPLYRYPTN
jgi:hypothetical protein